jgi:heme-degrading monooxygenase HmoA
MDKARQKIGDRTGRKNMHAMVRTYSGKGAKEFADLMEERKADVEKVLRSVPGLVSYSAVRTKEGVFSVSVWKDKPAIEEVHKKAMEWIKENAGHTKVKPPTVMEGSVLIQLH